MGGSLQRQKGDAILGGIPIRFAIIRCNRCFINIRELTFLLPIVYATQTTSRQVPQFIKNRNEKGDFQIEDEKIQVKILRI